jgi:hypothetical protein
MSTLSFMFFPNLIVHELAHQWFETSAGSWQDIWLNESFANLCNWKIYWGSDGDAALKTGGLAP